MSGIMIRIKYEGESVYALIGTDKQPEDFSEMVVAGIEKMYKLADETDAENIQEYNRNLTMLRDATKAVNFLWQLNQRITSPDAHREPFTLEILS